MSAFGSLDGACGAETTDWVDNPDVRILAGSGSPRTHFFKITPEGCGSWILSVSAEDPGRRAMSALLSTPNPHRLAVVERGSLFLGDVRVPQSFRHVQAHGPIVAAHELPNQGMLILLTPWVAIAIDFDGFRWQTEELAIDLLDLVGQNPDSVQLQPDSGFYDGPPIVVELTSGRAKPGRLRPAE